MTSWHCAHYGNSVTFVWQFSDACWHMNVSCVTVQWRLSRLLPLWQFSDACRHECYGQLPLGTGKWSFPLKHRFGKESSDTSGEVLDILVSTFIWWITYSISLDHSLNSSIFLLEPHDYLSHRETVMSDEDEKLILPAFTKVVSPWTGIPMGNFT